MAETAVEVTLYSCDGEEFRVPSAVASRSETVKNMLEDTGEEDAGQSPAKLLQTKTGYRQPCLVLNFTWRCLD